MILQYVSNTGIRYFCWVLQHTLVCSQFAWRYSFSQLSIRNLEYLEQSISLKYNGIEKAIHKNALIIKYAIDLLSDYI